MFVLQPRNTPGIRPCETRTAADCPDSKPDNAELVGFEPGTSRPLVLSEPGALTFCGELLPDLDCPGVLQSRPIPRQYIPFGSPPRPWGRKTLVRPPRPGPAGYEYVESPCTLCPGPESARPRRWLGAAAAARPWPLHPAPPACRRPGPAGRGRGRPPGRRCWAGGGGGASGWASRSVPDAGERPSCACAAILRRVTPRAISYPPRCPSWGPASPGARRPLPQPYSRRRLSPPAAACRRTPQR